MWGFVNVVWCICSLHKVKVPHCTNQPNSIFIALYSKADSNGYWRKLENKEKYFSPQLLSINRRGIINPQFSSYSVPTPTFSVLALLSVWHGIFKNVWDQVEKVAFKQLQKKLNFSTLFVMTNSAAVLFKQLWFKLNIDLYKFSLKR